MAMLKPGDSVDLAIEKPAAGGAMIARADGQVVFVVGAIPGERVTARVERVTRSLAHARVEAVLEPSSDRREPFPDPLCGGCLYSHIAYERQLELKSQVIADAFVRIGKIALPPVAVAASPEEGYRMRARLHVRGHRAGFFREGTHEICDARASRQLLPTTCDAIERLMAAIRSLRVEDVREIELSENTAATERVVHLDTAQPLDFHLLEVLLASEGFSPPPYVTDTLAIEGQTLTLRRHVLSFFQGNRYLLGDLVAHVTGHVPANASVIDLYAGAGLFAVAAATVRGASVVAVEGDRYAADDLRMNAAAAAGNVAAERSDVESFVVRSQSADLIIVDPPRTGMTTGALDGVVALKPRRLIYVSCDVATLARDARKLVDAGYVIGDARAFDLFPNTAHVESVIVFEEPSAVAVPARPGAKSASSA